MKSRYKGCHKHSFCLPVTEWCQRSSSSQILQLTLTQYSPILFSHSRAQYLSETSSVKLIWNYPKDYACSGLTSWVFKPSTLCSSWPLSDTTLEWTRRYSIVSSPALCSWFVMSREEFNLCQFPAIVPRHVATKYESVLTAARSCRKQERNHLRWWSGIVCFGRETF
jgi:hypothetical protein